MILAILVQPEELFDFSNILNLTSHTSNNPIVVYVRQADDQWLWDGFDIPTSIADSRLHLPIFTFSQFSSFSTDVTLDYLQSTYPEAFV